MKIFITATNTNIGKTYTTKLLLKEFSSKGLKVGVIKPIESGAKDIPLDAYELFSLAKELNPALSQLTLQDVTPFSFSLPAAPFIASSFKYIDILVIKNAIAKIEALCDVLLIEGAGGLFVPINQNYFMIDLIKELNAKTLLVSHCLLGCINDTLLSQMALGKYDIDYTTAFNCKDAKEEFLSISKPYFDKNSVDTLFIDDDIEKICDILYNVK